MDNRDFSNIGEEIRSSVQDAIDSMDFKQLNRTISDTVNSALDEARKQLMNGNSKKTGHAEEKEVYRVNYGEGGIADSIRNGRNKNQAGGDGERPGSAGSSCHNQSYGSGQKAENAGSGYQRFGSPHQRRDTAADLGGAGGGQTGYNRSRRNGNTDGPGYRPLQTSRQETAGRHGSAVRGPEVTAIRVNQSGRVAGILYTVFGGIGLGVSGILLLVVGILALVAKPLWGAVLGSSALTLLLTGVFGTMLGTGISIRRRLKRAKRYLEVAGERLYCDIAELSVYIGKSRKYVVKDLQKMIAKGILPEGHLDEQRTCLILSDETYRQYLETQKALKLRQQEEAALEDDRKKKAGLKEQEQQKTEASKSAERAENTEKMPEGLEQMMAEGRNYLRILREANEAIPGEIISAKISKLETVIRKIFESVERHPEQMEEMEKFMGYYLPTTVKLVNAYRDFDQVEIEGDNIASAKHEIEETLDTINRAFERLLDDLYQDAMIDITTDASVLQTMLEKDGFAGSDFDRRNEV